MVKLVNILVRMTMKIEEGLESEFFYSRNVVDNDAFNEFLKINVLPGKVI